MKKLLFFFLILMNTSVFTETNTSKYKNELISVLKEKEVYMNISDNKYYIDYFLEAYFNQFDFPDIENDSKIFITKSKYKKYKKYYKKFRNIKYFIINFKFNFTKYNDLKKNISGGFLTIEDYDSDKNRFYRDWDKVEKWMRYRLPLKGEEHLSKMIIMNGIVSIKISKREAKKITMRGFLKKGEAEFIGLIKIKESGKGYISIKPVSYIIKPSNNKKIYKSSNLSVED